jgi:hypothetical protein
MSTLQSPYCCQVWLCTCSLNCCCLLKHASCLACITRWQVVYTTHVQLTLGHIYSQVPSSC